MSTDNKNIQVTDEQLKEFAMKQMQEQETRKYDFPTEIVDLPSKGIVYRQGSELAKGTLEMKYMTAAEEDILTSPSLIKEGVVLDKLFKALIVSDISYHEMLLGDKNAIMVAARVLGYGKDYDFTVTCPKCGESHSDTIDLTKLDDKPLDPSKVEQLGVNKFKFDLPVSKRTLEFKLMTHGTEKKIEHELKARKKIMKKTGVNEELTIRMRNMILSVDGNDDLKEIAHFVQKEFFAQDSRAFRKHVADIQPDIHMTFDFACDNCGHEKDDTKIPIDVNFFWPGA